MKPLLIVLLLFFSLKSFSVDYFVRNGGNDGANGLSDLNAWATMGEIEDRTFNPGDRIFFKRGSTFTGTLDFPNSGSSGNPITIGAYGTGNDPIFTGTGSIISYLFYNNNRSWLVYENLKITDPDISAIDSSQISNIQRAITFDGGNNNIVQNCFIELAGVGFYSTGGGGSGNNTIQDCEITNLRMIVSSGSGDYGANPTIIENGNNTITRNYFHDCVAKSVEFVYDGGAVEIYNGTADNNIISYNRIFNCLAVSEYGSGSGGTCTNNQYYYNLCINNGNHFWINSSGGFQVAISGILIHNNVFVDQRRNLVSDNFLIGMGTNVTTAGQFEVKNNIYYVRASLDVVRSGQLSNGTSLVHENNRYNLASGGTLGSISLDATETSSTAAIWVDQTGAPETDWDFHPLDQTTLDDGVDLGYTLDYFGMTISAPYYLGIAQWVGGAVAPTVTTTAITSITSTTASSGGNVTADGGDVVTARGICWSTTVNPTTGDNTTSNGTGTGSFTSSLTGLSPATTYHVRAYATNSAGTSYGADISFTTLAILPTVTTTAVTSITQTTASSGGNVTSDGGAAVTVRGVAWSTAVNPTTADNTTSNGTSTGSFTSSLTGLTASTTYHVRAYATNSIGTSYGADISFTTSATPVAPTVTTTAVTSITQTTASSGGNVTSDGGAAVTVKGVAWSTSVNPTTADNTTSNGTGTGSFTSAITGLSPSTTYHVRAYATNSVGTSYGADISFTTAASISLPTVTTSSVTSITTGTVSTGGIVTSDGGATVTARGVCWSISANPTIGNLKTTNGSGTGSFTSSITGLSPSTTYHVRAYATNSAGTSYGGDVSFTTAAEPTNTYNTRKDIRQGL